MYKRQLFVDKLHPRFYYALLRESRAVLDTYPFGGYTTTMDALSVGTPVVTLRHQTLARGRATAAVLRALAKKARSAAQKAARRKRKAAGALELELVGDLGDLVQGDEPDLEWDLVADDKDGFVKKAAALSFDPFRAQLSLQLQDTFASVFGPAASMSFMPSSAISGSGSTGAAAAAANGDQWGIMLAAAAEHHERRKLLQPQPTDGDGGRAEEEKEETEEEEEYGGGDGDGDATHYDPESPLLQFVYMNKTAAACAKGDFGEPQQ